MYRASQNVVEAHSLLRRGLPNAIRVISLAATIPQERRFALAEVATWVGADPTENASPDRLSTRAAAAQDDAM
jgi:hypothetical protein